MSDMSRYYRKRPVVIEAVQLTRASATEVAEWCNGRVHQLVLGPGQRSVSVAITTLEGVMTANEGDWIIQGVEGEYYPCKPDIFEATYEPVDILAGE